jgi:hypothetical protein
MYNSLLKEILNKRPVKFLYAFMIVVNFGINCGDFLLDSLYYFKS